MSSLEKTSRGFCKVTFSDGNGENCSIQESSACREEGLIWLGIDDVVPKAFYPKPDGPGWVDIKKPKGAQDWLCSGRMHLTQSQVEGLLPFLEHFVKYGNLDHVASLDPGIGCPACRGHNDQN